ncbi:uncharacterized protein G2W53_036409 [Senna tora]|uniref:Uncharacterized protein n=1 Tax=Senna tora TaxID=362788 RepID=A0A834STY6_9FABA|nr:uncharacterized protein G2W53_036409 [Senna tora]
MSAMELVENRDYAGDENENSDDEHRQPPAPGTTPSGHSAIVVSNPAFSSITKLQLILSGSRVLAIGSALSEEIFCHLLLMVHLMGHNRVIVGIRSYDSRVHLGDEIRCFDLKLASLNIYLLCLWLVNQSSKPDCNGHPNIPILDPLETLASILLLGEMKLNIPLVITYQVAYDVTMAPFKANIWKTCRLKTEHCFAKWIDASY